MQRRLRGESGSNTWFPFFIMTKVTFYNGIEYFYRYYKSNNKKLIEKKAINYSNKFINVIIIKIE